MFFRSSRTLLIFPLLVPPKGGTLNVSQLCEVICSAYSSLASLPHLASWRVTLRVHGLVFNERTRGTPKQIPGSLPLLPPFLYSALQTPRTSASQTSTTCLLTLVTLLRFAGTLPPAAAQKGPPCWKTGSGKANLIYPFSQWFLSDLSVISVRQLSNVYKQWFHVLCPVVWLQ